MPAACTVPWIWGFGPAAVCTDAPVPPSGVHTGLPAAAGWPTASPIVIVGGGPAAVSVMLTCPAYKTLKTFESLLPTCTVPMNDSVVGGGVTGIGPFSEPVMHAATAVAANSEAPVKRNLRMSETLRALAAQEPSL